MCVVCRLRKKRQWWPKEATPCDIPFVPLRFDDATSLETCRHLQIATSERGVQLLYRNGRNEVADSWEFHFRNRQQVESSIKTVFYEALSKLLFVHAMRCQDARRFAKFITSSEGYACYQQVRHALEKLVLGLVIVVNHSREARIIESQMLVARLDDFVAFRRQSLVEIGRDFMRTGKKQQCAAEKNDFAAPPGAPAPSGGPPAPSGGPPASLSRTLSGMVSRAVSRVESLSSLPLPGSRGRADSVSDAGRRGPDIIAL